MTENIIIYGTTWCADCRRSKKFLDDQGVVYDWVDIEVDVTAADKVTQLNGGYSKVPTIVFPDGTVLVEPSNAQLATKVGVN